MSYNSINISKQQSSKDQHIMGMALILGLFMPNGNLFYFLVPVVILFLGLRYSTLNNPYSYTKMVLILLMLISLVIFAATNTAKLDTKGLLRNIVIFELILFFPFARNVQISNTYLYFGVIFIFISQISYISGISSVISFFNNNYPYEGDAYYYQSDYLISKSGDMSLTNRNFRLGGLFLNPNQCARYLTILFGVFLCENYSKNLKNILPFMIICILAIVATGSRTGFLITVLMLLWYIFRKAKENGRASKNLFIFLTISLAIVFALSISELAQTMRFLDFDEGLDKSLYMKGEIFTNYLANNSLTQMLFGNFSNDGVSTIQFDSEWGDLYYRYGILFIITFIIFYILIFRHTPRKYRLFFFVLLWVISSTLVLSYRAGFVFLLILSKYINEPWYDIKKSKLLMNLENSDNTEKITQ